MWKETIGLRYVLVFLCFALSTSPSARSRVLIDDAVGAPSPLAGDFVEDRMSMPDARPPQQSDTLIFVAGMSICFAIFIVSYSFAYKTIRARQGEVNRLPRAPLRSIIFEEQEMHRSEEEEPPRNSNGGLDASLVSSLPTVQYRSGMLKEEEMKAGGPLQNVMWVKECAVCLSEYEEGEEMKVLPVCGHCFHKACICMWLFSHSTCPICRLSLRKHMRAADPAIAELSQNTSASGPPHGLQPPLEL